jgi:hypothetical protein
MYSGILDFADSGPRYCSSCYKFRKGHGRPRTDEESQYWCKSLRSSEQAGWFAKFHPVYVQTQDSLVFLPTTLCDDLPSPLTALFFSRSPILVSLLDIEGEINTLILHRLDLQFCESISHEYEPVPAPVFDLKILWPQLLDHFLIE